MPMGPTTGQKTLLQAYRSGYIPKEGAETVAVWCGQGYHYYYNPEDLRKHPRAAAARLKKYMKDQRADRKAAKEAKEQKLRDAAAKEAERRELRKNTKTRYQWARRGFIANDDAKWEWGLSLGRGYGDWYKYTHIDNVHVGTPEELEPWWRFFLMELELKDAENAFIKLRTELLKLSPEYPFDILKCWATECEKDFSL